MMDYNFKRKDLIWFLSASIVVLLLAAYRVLSIQRDSANLSLNRLALLGLILVITVGFGILLFRILKTKTKQEFTICLSRRQNAIALFAMLLIFLMTWLALAFDPYIFEGSAFFYYERIKPLLVALGLIASGFTLLLLAPLLKESLSDRLQLTGRYRTLFLALSVALLAVFGLIYVSKFGLVKPQPGLWNVPGIPITTMQVYGVIVIISLLILLVKLNDRIRNFFNGRLAGYLIPMFLVLLCAYIWIDTPLLEHFFSQAPTHPTYQPYPLSDAAIHDMGALSILEGKGIFYGGYTDKPLYMVLLAGFHLLAGNDYNKIQVIQTCFLALSALFIYLIGEKLGNRFTGVAVALLLILHQRNAIFLARHVATVNVKLLMTEGVTMLGLLVLTYLICCWAVHKTTWLALGLGVCVGALSLIRANPIIFLPFLGLLILIVLRKHRKLLLQQGLALLFGFAILFGPWILTGVNEAGVPWLIIKIRDMYNVRVKPQTCQPMDGPLANEGKAGRAGYANMVSAKNERSMPKGETGFVMFASQHFVHNITTSLMVLPDTLLIQKLDKLAKRDYWRDYHDWDGTLPAGQLVMTGFNLTLLALGVTLAWKKVGWVGLVPIFVFMVYNLGISLSLTSGGRYIVPINWVVYFYYAVGIQHFFMNHLIISFFTDLRNTRL